VNGLASVPYVLHREDLGSVLSKESRQGLGFSRRRTPGKAHPGWRHLAAALAGVGAIPGKVRGVSVSDDYLVSAKLGKVVFRGMFPVSLGWLRSQLGNELMEALESHWAVRQDFKIAGIVTGVTPSAVSKLRQVELKTGKRAA